MKLAPTNPWTFNNLCYDLAIKGDTGSAMPHCEEALQLAPKEPAILDSRGYTYLRMKDYQHAIEDYDAVLKASPRLAPSLFGRAIAYAALGKNDLAKADLAAARDIDPAIDKEMAVIHLSPPSGL
jgi:tetratricopeptide (TPR) repeat protein